MAVFPSDSGKSVTRSIIICCHFRSGSGIGCSAPAFFLWSDFTNWQTGQDRMYSPMVLHIPRHQKALLMWSTVVLSPTCPIARTSWSSRMIFCCRTLGTRDVHWSKFVGTGKERNASPFKKDLSLSRFFRFFSFLEWVFPLFPIFLGISHPVLRRSFPIFSSFHLSKPVLGFLMGLKLAILDRVLNENLSKPVPCHSWNRSSPFLKSFLVFPQPIFLSNKQKQEPRTASVLKGYTLANV